MDWQKFGFFFAEEPMEEEEIAFTEPCYVCHAPVEYVEMGNGEEWALPKCAYCDQVVCEQHSHPDGTGYLCCSDPRCRGEEEIALEESIQDTVVRQEPLGVSSFAVVYGDGGVTINDESMGLVALSAAEAYALAEMLYQHMDLLRSMRDEPPLRLLTEQKVQALADRIMVSPGRDSLAIPAQ